MRDGLIVVGLDRVRVFQVVASLRRGRAQLTGGCLQQIEKRRRRGGTQSRRPGNCAWFTGRGERWGVFSGVFGEPLVARGSCAGRNQGGIDTNNPIARR